MSAAISGAEPLVPQAGLARCDSSRTRFLAPAALATAVAGAYTPVLLREYGFSDDYFALWSVHADGSVLSHIDLMNGRPGMLVLHWLVLPLVGNVSGLRWLRLLAVLLTAGFAVRLFATARRHGRSTATAWGLAAAVAALPSAQVAVSWSILFVAPLAATLGLTAGQQALRSRYAASTGLLLAALLIYQPAAMCFLLAPALALTDPTGGRPTWGALRSSLAVYVAAAAASVVIWQLPTRLSGESGDRTRLAPDLLRNAWQFLTHVLPRALWPASIQTSAPLAVAAGVVLLVGCWLGTRRPAPFLTLLALIPMSFAPSLASAMQSPATRAMAGLMPVTVVLLAFAARSIGGELRTPRLAVGPAAVAIGCAMLLLAAVSVELYFARPQHRELQIARQVVHDDVSSVSQARTTDTFAPAISYDEFGMLTSTTPWGAWGLAQVIYHERTRQWLPENAVQVTNDDPVVDFRQAMSTSAKR